MSSVTPASSTGGDYGEVGLTRCQVALWLGDGASWWSTAGTHYRATTSPSPPARRSW
jgi:hypothetical protein